MALSVVQWDSDKSTFKVGGSAPDFRAGKNNVGAGVTSLAITFGTELPSSNYAIVCTWENTTSSFPQFQNAQITSRSTTGFTIAWPAPTDSSNYRINWIVMQNG